MTGLSSGTGRGWRVVAVPLGSVGRTHTTSLTLSCCSDPASQKQENQHITLMSGSVFDKRFKILSTDIPNRFCLFLSLLLSLNRRRKKLRKKLALANTELTKKKKGSNGGGGGWLRLNGAGVDVVSGCEKKYKVYDGSLFCIQSNNLVPTHSGGGTGGGEGGWRD